MELLYIWVENYKNIHQQGFNFSPQHRFHYNPNTQELTHEKHTPLPDNFFGTQVTNLTAIVGENGSGKSTLLEIIALVDTLANGYLTDIREPVSKNKDEANKHIKEHIGNILIVYKTENKKLVCYNNMGVKGKLEFSPRPIKYGSIYYNPLIGNDFLGKIYNRRGLNTPFKNISNEYILKEQASGRDTEAYRPWEDRKDKRSEHLFIYNRIVDFFEGTVFDFFERIVEKDNFQNIANKKFKFPFSLPESFNIESIYGVKLEKIKEFAQRYIKEKKIGENNWLEKILNVDLEISPKNDFAVCCRNLFFIFSLELFIAAFSDYNGYSNNIDSYKYDDTIFDENIKNFKDAIDFIKTRYMSIALHSSRINRLQNLFDILNNYNISNLADNFSFGKKEIVDLVNSYFENNGDIFIFKIKIKNFSTGEQALLTFFGRLYDAIQELRKKKQKEFILILDELETGLHPDWQKRIVNYILEFLNQDEFKDIKVQIIMTTHSPFILSDLPKENIIFLKKDAEGNCEVVDRALSDNKQTFSANIHSLLADSFFMQGALVGDFAKKKINEIIHLLTANKKLTEPEITLCESTIPLIGEPIIREKLFKMLAEKREFKTHDEVANIKKQIAELNARLTNLEPPK